MAANRGSSGGNFWATSLATDVWDFAEIVTTGDQASNFTAALDWVREVIERGIRSAAAQVQSADAADHPLPDQAAGVWFTDPPYYDAVPYADLSDFLSVWLKRTLPNDSLFRDPFDADNALFTPRGREAVQDETKKHEDQSKDRNVVRGRQWQKLLQKAVAC